MENQLLDITSFKEWMHLKEVATTTADVAGFRRITIPLVRRLYPQEITFDNKKKPRWQPQVKD